MNNIITLIEIIKIADKKLRPSIVQLYIAEYGPIPNEYEKEIRELLELK